MTTWCPCGEWKCDDGANLCPCCCDNASAIRRHISEAIDRGGTRTADAARAQPTDFTTRRNMTRQIGFTVYGLPAAQGSKRHVGGGVMIESSKAVKPWRQDVVAAALDAIGKWEAETGCPWEPFTGPVNLKVTFYFGRPKSHYRTGRHANLLKPAAPVYVAKSPDLDKCVRSSADALTTSGIWRDDALLCRVVADKVFASAPGARFHLQELLS